MTTLRQEFDRAERHLAARVRAEAENARLRKRLADFYSRMLQEALDERTEDGVPILELVFDQNPELARGLANALWGVHVEDVQTKGRL